MYKMKDEWKIDPEYAKQLHELWGSQKCTLTPIYDEPKVQMFHVDTIHEYQLKDNDIIILTFDNEMWGMSEVKQMMDYFQQEFPNHKVIAKFNGVQMDILHMEKDEREASW